MNLDVSVSKHLGDFHLNAEFQITGRRTGVFGPSGSGKSTLVKVLSGLVKPDDGHILMDGEPLFHKKMNINIPPEKRKIGVVFQHAHLFPHMNVRRNLLYGYRRIREAERKISPDALINVLALDSLLDRNVARLSGGERQRVALGRTLLACPRLILMDEPLAGLDRDLKQQIIPYLLRVLDEFDVPLVFISHSPMEMRLMTDEVLVFGKGIVQKKMTTDDLEKCFPMEISP